MQFVRRLVFPFFLACFLANRAQAITLNWGSVAWTPGSLANSYDIDPAQPGNDVTVTVSGNTGQLQPEVVSPFPMTPAITTNFQGGLTIGSCLLAAVLILRHSAKFRK